MTSQVDILGRPPIRKRPASNPDITLEGPGFEELCKPLSAKVLPRAALAASNGEKGALKQQRREGRR